MKISITKYLPINIEVDLEDAILTDQVYIDGIVCLTQNDYAWENYPVDVNDEFILIMQLIENSNKAIALGIIPVIENLNVWNFSAIREYTLGHLEDFISMESFEGSYFGQSLSHP